MPGKKQKSPPRHLLIGTSDFKTVIDKGCLYVDKSLFIEELMERSGEVVLIPRMRRFGKTLNLSMVRYFFEKGKEETSYLFSNLKIWKNEKCRAKQGQYPVIFITLKDVRQETWYKALNMLQSIIARELERHAYILDVLSASEREIYNKIVRDGDEALLQQSLYLLTEWLHRYHGKKVILLIDEYDAPVPTAFTSGYYDSLIGFLRNWYSAGLEDNSHLEQGVMTGILRVAKESIFSGLNNVRVCSILSSSFSDKFGLLESEVEELLEEYDLKDKLPDFRKWYDGYRSGSRASIYNPWSVLNCIASQGAFAPYWVNTSDNELVRKLIAEGSDDLKADLEELMRGGVLEKMLEEGVVFANLAQKANTVWALLLFCGYLTLDETPVYGVPCKLRVPNLEIQELYTSIVLEWFEKTICETNYRELLNSLVSGDVTTFSQIFKEFFDSSISLFDVTETEAEKVYHAFVLGMMVGLKDRYQVKSNRESGYGRYDVMLIPKDLSDLGIVMEFKKVGRFEKMSLEAAVRSALYQIEKKDYAQELINAGVKNILYLGFAFRKKKVLIRSKKLSRGVAAISALRRVLRHTRARTMR